MILSRAAPCCVQLPVNVPDFLKENEAPSERTITTGKIDPMRKLGVINLPSDLSLSRPLASTLLPPPYVLLSLPSPLQPLPSPLPPLLLPSCPLDWMYTLPSCPLYSVTVLQQINIGPKCSFGSLFVRRQVVPFNDSPATPSISISSLGLPGVGTRRGRPLTSQRSPLGTPPLSRSN